MTFADDLKATLEGHADLMADVPGGIWLEPLRYDMPGVFVADSTGTARVVPTIFMYEVAEPRSGPFQTSSQVFFNVACYGPTISVCETLERRIRSTLHTQSIGGRHVTWRDARKATPDAGYDPPELYTLGRYVATGFWE